MLPADASQPIRFCDQGGLPLILSTNAYPSKDSHFLYVSSLSPFLILPSLSPFLPSFCESCMLVYINVHTRVYQWSVEVSNECIPLLHSSLFFFLRKDLSLSLDLTVLARLAGHQGPQDPSVSTCPNIRVTGTHYYIQTLCECQGSKFGALCSHASC